MPRRAKEPHLLWIKPAYQPGPEKKLKSRGYWAIKDGARGVLRSTGCSLEQHEEAKVKLHEYNTERYGTERLPQVGEVGTSVREVLIVDLIRFYIERNAEKIAAKTDNRRRDYLNSIERLIRFWADKTVYDITEETCRDYQQKARPSKPLAPDTARRELEDLKAMVKLGVRKRLVSMDGHEIDWWLPSKARPRYTHYSRDEVAKLVWTAYRRRNPAIGSGLGHKTSVHLARFILVAVYTGTRSDRIERACFTDTPGRPWLDLSAGIDEDGEPYGIFYRAGDGERVPDNKAADACRIPRNLRAHLVRWHRGLPSKKGSYNLIEHNGEIGSTKRSFYELKNAVFPEERARKVNRHTLKHTAATWLLRAGVSLRIVANYLSTTEKIIESVYGKNHPGWHSEVDDAFRTGRAGRGKRGREGRGSSAAKRDAA